MATRSEGKKAIVLVVEDEAMLRMAAMDLVAHAGFEAIEASNAVEAIRILEARTDIHIVFTDVDMPGSMDGIKLVEAVRGRWPPIEIIVTSGHRIVAVDDLPKGSVFFAKPYRDEQIVAALRRMSV